ncbi:MAG: hypothetical protein IJ646_01135 [Clostridia bacterium]|nr:hypothetical protein [Clostridia bacterium]
MKRYLTILLTLALLLCGLAAAEGGKLLAPKATEAPAEGEATYTVYVVDQNGDPVPEAAVGFCVDTGCMPIEADENGVATYTGAPTRYHLQVVDAPDEYDWPDESDVYIGPESGEATLVVTKG